MTEHDPAFNLKTPQEYLEAVDNAKSAAISYYNTDELLIDDSKYDQLIRSIESAERENPEWKIEHNLFSQVAAGVSYLGDSPHLAPLLSLDNVFSSEELREWCQSRNKDGLIVTCFTVEPKFDGLSVAVTYSEGNLIKIATRGNGLLGENVTYSLERIHNLPAKLSEPVSFELRGEVLFTRQDYQEANLARVSNGMKPYVNARNAAAGALRKENLDYPVRLTFFAHGQVGLDGKSHSANMKYLQNLGIPVEASDLPIFSCNQISEAVSRVDHILSLRSSIPFEIDGAVVKVDNLTQQQILGFSSRAPKWGIAFKFPAEEVSGIVGDIEVQVGRLGTITPVAKINPPVFVGGTTISSITLHNFDDLTKRDVRVGDTVIIRRAGDVIPEISGVLLSTRPEDRAPFAPPLTCPRCGSPIDKTQIRWRCTRGRICGLVESIVYAAGRDQLDIEGCGEKVANQLVSNGLVSDIADLFTLTREQLVVLDRYAETSASNLLAQIQNAKQQPLSRVLAALGVRMTGRSMSKRLARTFGTMDALIAADVEKLASVDGVGPERASTIIAELIELTPTINKLRLAGVNLTEEKQSKISESSISGKTVVVTGSLGSLTRNEVQEAVERLGGIPTTSVSKKTDLLVIGVNPGPTKVNKGELLGIKTISGDQFLLIIDEHNI